MSSTESHFFYPVTQRVFSSWGYTAKPQCNQWLDAWSSTEWINIFYQCVLKSVLRLFFWPEHIICSVPMSCALWRGHSPLPSSPLQQATSARQTRPEVQSICLDKCGDLGPRQAMQGRVLIVCVPSNSPQSPGLSSHSIHPGLCLVSNLNLTYQTRENGIQVIFFPSFTITFCLLKDQTIVQAWNFVKCDFSKYSFFILTRCFFHALSSVQKGVTVGGWMGSRWVGGRCGPLLPPPHGQQ